MNVVPGDVASLDKRNDVLGDLEVVLEILEIVRDVLG
jgi:hypothetical protein